MKVNSSTTLEPKLYGMNGQGQVNKQPKMETGTIPGLKHDTVDISPTGRQLAVGAIEHHVATYYGNAEINDSLNRILDGKSPEIRTAVYTIIQSNLVPDGTVSDSKERAALLELGLTQAKYIADNYFKDGEAAEMLNTMNKIAAMSHKETINPVAGNAAYIPPSQKPQGAPDDYVNITDLMKRFEPESHGQLQDAIVNGGDWSGILMKFAHKIPQNKEWLDTYRQEASQPMKEAPASRIDSRFNSANTADMAAFVKDLQSMIQKTQLANTDFLSRNIDYFAHVLGYRAS